jgi:hypothetical protein
LIVAEGALVGVESAMTQTPATKQKRRQERSGIVLTNEASEQTEAGGPVSY